MEPTTPFVVRLPRDLDRKLTRLAKKMQDTKARQIREALREYIKKHEELSRKWG